MFISIYIIFMQSIYLVWELTFYCSIFTFEWDVDEIL